MSESDVIVLVSELQQFISDLFFTTEMSRTDADLCAEALIQTNLWGIDSHGVLRTPVYFQRLHESIMNPTPNIKKVRGDGALEVLDGDDGVGFVVGRAAMSRAIELAKQFSIGAVGVVHKAAWSASGVRAAAY